MPSFKVALLQMAGNKLDQAANIEKADDFCRKAAALGADVALFPEMWNVGYYFPKTEAEIEPWLRCAVDIDSEYVQRFRKLAAELNMAIAATYLEKWPGKPRNSVALFDRSGAHKLTYAKVHTCQFDKESMLTPGDDFPVCTLETASGKAEIGFMICFDREFPESARILMLNGAEIILTPNACELEENRLGQFRARAYENMLGVAIANYAKPQNNGHSAAFHPIAHTKTELSKDTLAVMAGEREGVFIADFDLDAIREFRKSEVWGNAYRRPSVYEKLLDGEVRPQFARNNVTR